MFHGEKNNWNDYRSAEQNAFFQNSRETQYTENIDDVGFIDALISQMQETYGVSKNNVFIFGVSNGGLMTQRYVLDGKTPIQAAAFLASNVPKLQENESYETKIPLLLWLGTADPLMKFPPQNDSTFPFLSGEESASWWTKQNAPLTQGTTETLSSVDTNACFTQRVIYSGEHPLYFYTSQG